MSDYKVKMNLSIEDIKNGKTNTSVDLEVNVSDEEACSIDAMEKILLSMDKDILRAAVSQHFERISKKKPKLSEKEWEELFKRMRNLIK